MAINWRILTRKTHYWGAAIIAAPVAVIIGSGLLLQLKKHVAWIQPPTQRGAAGPPAITFDAILEAAKSVPEAAVSGWEQIDRLDVQPQRGLIKIHATNHVEIQIDHASGKVLQVAHRRSDLIEDIHDGSFFHDSAKLWIFLPTAAGLLMLWGTGVYLFFLPFIARRSSKRLMNG
jgi:hypothetical protein